MSFLKAERKDNLAIDLGSAYSLLNEEYQNALKRIEKLELEIARLKEQLALMQHQRFGKKTEVSLGEAVVDELQTVAGYIRKKAINR